MMHSFNFIVRNILHDEWSGPLMDTLLSSSDFTHVIPTLPHYTQDYKKHVHVHFFLISTAFQFSWLLIKKYCTICTQMKFMYALKYIWIIQPACLVHEIQVGWSFLTRHISDIRVSCNFSVLWTSLIRVDDSRDHRLFNEVKFNVI